MKVPPELPVSHDPRRRKRNQRPRVSETLQQALELQRAETSLREEGSQAHRALSLTPETGKHNHRPEVTSISVPPLHPAERHCFLEPL